MTFFIEMQSDDNSDEKNQKQSKQETILDQQTEQLQNENQTKLYGNELNQTIKKLLICLKLRTTL